MRVTINFVDGKSWKKCWLHVPDKLRVSDVANDDREFLPVYRPVTTGKDKFCVVRKDRIESITED